MNKNSNSVFMCSWKGDPNLYDFRAVNCAVLVNNFMGMAVSYAIADKSFLNETKPKVTY